MKILHRSAVFVLALIAVPLAGCGASGLSVAAPPVISSPAPLAASTLDEKAIATAFTAFDGLLSAVDVAVASGVIEPGSPRALDIQRKLQSARAALNAADDFRRAGNDRDALSALSNAQSAFEGLRTVLKGDVR